MTAVLRRDLAAYFHSPVGYGFIILFSVIMNFFFYLFNVLGGSSDVVPLFSLMLLLLMLLLPLLTMRLFAEEHRQKTDQLLFAAPTPMWQVVTGKFLAALSVFAIALLTTLPWSVIIARYGVWDGPAVGGQYVAILFAASAFLAIGIFLSALTESQFIAAIATFGVYFALYSLHSLAATVGGTALKGALVWFSLYLRYQRFVLGIFSVTDVFFYLTFTALMLFLTAHVIERRR